MRNWKDNISFVLVEPKKHGNIGASARAMKNMGFKHLCFVRPPHILTEEAGWYAHNSLEMLEKAERYDTVRDAVAQKNLVVGVARRVGKKRGMVLPVDEGSRKILEFSESSNNKVALLFGREDRGLYNSEVDECGFVMTIPSNREHPSLNLSHAVMVVAYELSMSGRRQHGKHEPCMDASMNSTDKKPVTHGELTSLYERASEVLTLLDYLPRGDRDIRQHIMSNIKHFLGRAGLTDWELKMLHGICSQIERKVEGNSDICPREIKLETNK